MHFFSIWKIRINACCFKWSLNNWQPAPWLSSFAKSSVIARVFWKRLSSSQTRTSKTCLLQILHTPTRFSTNWPEKGWSSLWVTWQKTKWKKWDGEFLNFQCQKKICLPAWHRNVSWHFQMQECDPPFSAQSNQKPTDSHNKTKEQIYEHFFPCFLLEYSKVKEIFLEPFFYKANKPLCFIWFSKITQPRPQLAKFDKLSWVEWTRINLWSPSGSQTRTSPTCK